MLANIGHNSAAYGQMLKPVLPAAPKGPKQRFPYFKFYPRDWLESTRGLTLEQRGAYIDLICILMEMEGHLVDDDKWIAHHMHVNARKWRSMKQGLVEHQKIAIQDGQIVNDRCLKEIDALMTQRRNLADSAVKRERNKRETSVKHPGNIDENSEKINENNGSDTTVVPLRARVLDLDTDKEEKKEPPTVPLEGDDAPKRRRSSVPEEYPKGFEAFWEIYPRKVGKGAASKAWGRLSLEQRRRAYRALKEQRQSLRGQIRTDGNYCPHPATWINEGRFDDEPPGDDPSLSADALMDKYKHIYDGVI